MGVARVKEGRTSRNGLKSTKGILKEVVSPNNYASTAVVEVRAVLRAVLGKDLVE
jgi:hypothetical protein